jgi:hypothetical protein
MEGDSSASEPQEYGLTTVGIGSAGAQSITLTQQWVAGMATKTYFVGLFGLANTSLDLEQAGYRRSSMLFGKAWDSMLQL